MTVAVLTLSSGTTVEVNFANPDFDSIWLNNSNPSTPSNGIKLFSNSGNLSWKNSSGNSAIFSVSGGNNILTIPNKSGTVAVTNGVGGTLDAEIIPSVPGISSVLQTPTNVSVSTTTTGGGWGANLTYYFKVVAVDPQGGLSLPSSEVSVTTGAGTTNRIIVSFTAVPGATTYRVYRGTSGAQTVYHSPGAGVARVISGTIDFELMTSLVTTGTPPATATGYSILINNSFHQSPILYSVNGGLVFQPNGNPGTTVLGNSRGIGAVDLAGGRSNSASVASGNYSGCVGGNNPTASGLSSGTVGGANPVASGSYSGVIGGQNGIAAGSGSAAVACFNSTISGRGSSGVGAENGSTSANYSSVRGFYPVANLFGQSVSSNSRFTAAGDNQKSELQWSITTTNTATATELRLDGNSGTNFFVVANNSTQPFSLMICARGIAGTNDDKSAYWKVDGLVVNNAGVITIPAATITPVYSDVPAWSFALSVVSTRLAITVTGDAASTIQWNAAIIHLINIG